MMLAAVEPVQDAIRIPTPGPSTSVHGSEVLSDRPVSCRLRMALEPPHISLSEHADPRWRHEEAFLQPSFTIPILVIPWAHDVLSNVLLPSHKTLVWIQCLWQLRSSSGRWPFFPPRGLPSSAQSEHVHPIAVWTGTAYLDSLVATLFPGFIRVHSGSTAGSPTFILRRRRTITTLVPPRAGAGLVPAADRQRDPGTLRLARKRAPGPRDLGDQDVPLDQVKPGDRLRVRPGKRVRWME